MNKIEVIIEVITEVIIEVITEGNSMQLVYKMCKICMMTEQSVHKK